MEYSAGSFTLFDYAILILMLAFSASIGIYYRFSGGRQKTNKEYFLANKDMPITPVAFSLMASFMSAVTILGVASENYMNGTQFVIINIAYIIGTPIAAFIFLPVFFQMQATSAFEYLERRFSKETRLLASSIFILQMVLYMSIVLYAPALTLSAVTGLSTWTSVLSIGTVCTFYSTIGGMKAVLWTDLFQSVLMFLAVFAVIAKGTIDVGGFSQVFDIASKGERIQFFNFDPDPTVRHTVWSLAIGGIFTYTSIYAVNQAQIQRLLTVKSLKKSQIALFINWPITSLLSVTTSLAGIVVYANLWKCDPLLRSEETHVTRSDQILPYYVMASLSVFPGLPGLFVSGVFSAALSTVSSAINSLAAVTVEDYLRPLCFRNTSESRIANFTKLTAFIYGLLCILLTFVVEKLGGVLEASLTIFNVIGGPMLGLYSLGMLCRRANAKGSVVGFISSIILCMYVGLGSMLTRNKTVPVLHRSLDDCPLNKTFIVDSYAGNFFNVTTESNEVLIADQNHTSLEVEDKYIFPLLRLSYMWYAALGWFTCMIVGLSASFIFGKEKAVDPVLLSPVVSSWSSKKSHEAEEFDLTECT
ncbi:putative sodium-dependent multivitamin transporter [Parasteatoda tepidariorum]|nr:putative sodium-dependent multivitamin transporter [Parasteatoda tepidariorum]XP_015916104.1 putative sodium-dependent multivitamin transporter [Parasteatoda tepidariorum]